MTRTVKTLLLILLGAVAISGCRLVDEDLFDCETEYTIDYELRMVTNMSTEISTQLSLATDIQIAQSLRTYLDGVFTDYAHDVDLGFYDVVRDDAVGDSLRLFHETHVMDASQSSYTLYIPIRDYMHLAVANIEDNGQVLLENGGTCHAARLNQPVRDTVESHRTGIFTARLPMYIIPGVSQTFDVDLYMANCASAIVIDTVGSQVRDLQVYATGFATGFNICDSTYLYPYTPVVRADRVTGTEAGTVCFAAVTFPSRDPERVDTKVVIETDDPFISGGGNGTLWRYSVYSTMEDGTVTETILGVSTPLRAGQLKINTAKALPNGAVQPGDPTVGVSVTLDWEPGSQHEIEL